VKLEIAIDPTQCRGAGECVLRASSTFALSEEGRAIVRSSPHDADDQVMAAARACPHFAISILRDGTKLI
jgi:ferredoxin